jgi:hypothetical protein
MSVKGCQSSAGADGATKGFANLGAEGATKGFVNLGAGWWQLAASATLPAPAKGSKNRSKAVRKTFFIRLFPLFAIFCHHPQGVVSEAPPPTDYQPLGNFLQHCTNGIRRLTGSTGQWISIVAWRFAVSFFIMSGYKKTLYEILYASPIRFAMSTEIARVPFSISETWCGSIPKAEASSFCLRPSRARKPRNLLPGLDSGKTSFKEYDSSPSSFTGQDKSISSNMPVIALHKESADSLGTARCISVKAPVVRVFMRSNIKSPYVSRQIRNLPHRHITRLAFVQMKMAPVRLAFDFPLMVPVQTLWAFLLQFFGKKIKGGSDCLRQFTFLFTRLASEGHRPERFLFILQDWLFCFLKN